MEDRKKSLDRLLTSLQERAKELDCYYRVQKILKDVVAPIDEICREIVCIMPPGWRYPDLCRVKIILGNTVYSSPDCNQTPWFQSADIVVDEKVVGSVTVRHSDGSCQF